MSITEGDAPLLATGDGLARVMGDQALYLQLLRRFQHDYHGAMATVRHSLDHGDLPLAQRLLHTLKGAAGMIGAQALHEQAAALEPALAAPQPPFEQLARFEFSLRALLAEIAVQLAAAPPSAPASAPSSGRASPALLGQLARLLDEGNGAAIDVLEQSATQLAASLGLERYQQVAAAAHEFDFEAALAALTPGL